MGRMVTFVINRLSSDIVCGRMGDVPIDVQIPEKGESRAADFDSDPVAFDKKIARRGEIDIAFQNFLVVWSLSHGLESTG